MAGTQRHDFATRAELAEGLASVIAARLSAAIEARGHALIAVSGGTTPALLFETLSKADIAWEKVVVTLIDERFVPEDSPRSNAGLVKSRLLQNKAATAKFIGLAGSGIGELEAAAATADAGLRVIGLPLDVAILGMGNDGHTASFFPDATELEELLSDKNPALVASVHAESAGESRLTLTLPPIASARFVALHIEGSEKQATLEKALAPGAKLPIRRVIDAANATVEIYWAP
jgi:6-phosphogluconolactonase